MDNVKYLNSTVWAKLAPSSVHGIGVFAIRDIKKGTLVTDYSIHTINNVGFLKISEEEFQLLDPEIRDLILDHTLFQEGQQNLYFYSPNMEVCLTSFMNHSDDPNCDGQIAIRDIMKGEEITEDYNTLFHGKNPHHLIQKHHLWLKKEK